MKIILITNKKYIILLYILTIIVPCNLSKYINKNNKIIVDIIHHKKYFSEFTKNTKNYININFDKDKEKDIDIKDPPFAPFPLNKTEKDDDKHSHDHDNIFDDDDDDEKMREEIFSQIRDLDDKIDDLNREITKRKIYVAFLGIITIILFLILVIYCSIKCYILCTKKHHQNYRVSYISENKLGEVYIDENGEEKFNLSIKNRDESEAPIYSNNNYGNNVSTFNPDNYKGSDEDKNLYKPYKSEDIL